MPLKKEPLNKDSWFAGFVDAKVSFSIQLTKADDKAKKKKNIL